MTERRRWQVCQIEVRQNGTGVLKQFIADQAPTIIELHENWPAMLGKLGDQGWELISAVPGDPKKSGPIIYLFKRPA